MTDSNKGGECKLDLSLSIDSPSWLKDRNSPIRKKHRTDLNREQEGPSGFLLEEIKKLAAKGLMGEAEDKETTMGSSVTCDQH